MSESELNQDVNAIVDHNVKRRVAKKVMRDIHHTVDEIKQEQYSENRARKFVIPLLAIVTAFMALLVLWPGVMRLLSGFVS